MAITWLTLTEITPGSTGWQDVDLSSYIPSGATGVILQFRNTSTTTNLLFGCRKNGSTDARPRKLYGANQHIWAFCGVDANRVCEIYVENTTDLDVWLVAAFGSEAVFNTNAIDKSFSTKNTWVDIDVSSDTGADTAIGALFEHFQTANDYDVIGFRKNGSTDTKISSSTYAGSWAFVGLDANEICEGYIDETTSDFYLTGYIKSDATFNTNATDMSLGSTGAYTDLSALPAGATGGFFEVISATAASYYYSLRKKGDSIDIYSRNRYHHWAAVACDASRIVEGKIENTGLDFYLVGYSSQTITPTGIASTLALGSLTLSPGNVNLGLTGIASTLALGSLTLSPGNVNLGLTGIASTLALGSLTLSPGNVNLGLTGIASTVQIGTLTLVPGPVVMELSGIPPGSQFGTLTLVPGEIILALAGIASTAQFGELTLAFDDLILSLTGIPSGVVIGDLALRSSLVHVKVSGVWKAATVYAKVGGEWQDISIIKGKVTEIWK